MTDQLRQIAKRRGSQHIQWGGPPFTGNTDVDWLIAECCRLRKIEKEAKEAKDER